MVKVCNVIVVEKVVKVEKAIKVQNVVKFINTYNLLVFRHLYFSVLYLLLLNL